MEGSYCGLEWTDRKEEILQNSGRMWKTVCLHDERKTAFRL